MVVVDPPLNVYPPLSVTVTLWPAVGTPPTVTVTYAPVIVPHAVPLYVALSNASAVTPEADAIGAIDAAAITGTDHAAPVRIVRRDGAEVRDDEVDEVSGSRDIRECLSGSGIRSIPTAPCPGQARVVRGREGDDKTVPSRADRAHKRFTG
ncbi:hypothetical protein [Microbacterium enclense]|uniref:hypothetical protein n=1 Tax=Microbacterium enclense TaxID=993073 RepID=UPI003D740404